VIRDTASFKKVTALHSWSNQSAMILPEGSATI